LITLSTMNIARIRTTVILFSLIVALSQALIARGGSENPDLPREIYFPDSLLRFPEFQSYIDTYAPEEDCLCFTTSGYLNAVGYEVFVHRFTGSDVPRKGTIWLVHGYLHHSGYYLDFASRLAAEGWDLILMDLPGHGLSGGDPADIEDFAEYGDLIQDLTEFPMFSESPRPWVAMGHSTGASALIEHGLSFSPGFDRYILLAPLVRSASWNLSQFGLSLGGRRIKDIPRRIRKSSGDGDFMRFMRTEDFLAPRRIPVSWVEALVRWNDELERTPSSIWNRAFASIDITIIQGDSDSVVDWRYNLPFLNELLPRADFREIAGARHDLLFESADLRTQVMGILYDALNSAHAETR
jgi:alpha-beta hydrolase superfamily lysophospholipase